MIGPLAGIVFAACIALASYRLRWLTRAGSLGQFVLGALLFGIGGWPWAVPIIVFFLTSSLLSILFRERRGDAELYYAKASRRDLMQVLANGGVGGVLVLMMSVFGFPHAYIAYAASCAAANADTWATEIGTMFPGNPRMIIGFGKVDRGRSGAVSLHGTLAATAGSVAIAASVFVFIPEQERWLTLAIVSLSGLAGSLIDSVLGATVQGQWKCQECGRTIEIGLHCSKTAAPISGWSFITNDVVNLISIAGAACLAWLAMILLS